MIPSSKLVTTAHIMGLTKSISLLLLLVTASPAFSHTESPINLYQANYSATFSGLNINAVQKLEEIEPGIYRESLAAKNFIGKIHEQSTFRVTANQQIYPTEYRYNRSVLGRDHSEVQSFDWQSSKVQYQKDGHSSDELGLKDGYLDMITHRLQLRRDLNAGKEVFSYAVISRGKLKQYEYKVVSEQILQTAIGPLNTVKVERVTDDEDKKISVWLASDWDYLVVKLEQSKGRDGHHLELRDAEINNKKITPLAIIDEKQL